MPRINQLPSASSVAQTDVLAIDTPEKTYQVPRSVLAPAPFQATIQPGYWSGSGSDYYFTVFASNVTANAQLYPFYDKASDALLNSPVWVIPADGSFAIHTSAIPSGTVTISVLLAGIVGEAQYQVLADVYSTSQVDSKIAQSTAKYGNVTFLRYWNVDTLTVDLGFIPTLSKSAQALLFNSNQAVVALITFGNADSRVDVVSGNKTFTISRNDTVFTITSSGTLWGNTTLLLDHN